MASTTLFRLATRVARPASVASRIAVRSSLPVRTTPSAFAAANTFSTSSKRLSGGHEEETYEEFSARYAAIPLSLALWVGTTFCSSKPPKLLGPAILGLVTLI